MQHAFVDFVSFCKVPSFWCGHFSAGWISRTEKSTVQETIPPLNAAGLAQRASPTYGLRTR